MHLIHRNDRERLGISLRQIESPLFAAFDVKTAIHEPLFSCRHGLTTRSNGKAWSPEEILDAVENGDLLLVTNDPFSPLSNDTSGKYSHITGKGWAGGFHKTKVVESLPPTTYQPTTNPQSQEPGFYIAPKSTTLDQLKVTLFASPSTAVLKKFDSLNPNLKEVKAGSMIVLSDPHNFQCTREDAQLMEAAAQTYEALTPLSADEADFMQRNREEIQNFLAQGSTAIGAGEAMFTRNLSDLKNILREIEALHQKTFLKDGHLRSPDFFSERKRLLAQLDIHLTSLVRKGIGLPDHPNLKSALGISSRSLVHRWTQAGAPGQIPGYATHIHGVAKAAKVIKYGGWVGTAIGGGSSYMKVQDVCSAGDIETCERVKFSEAGNFIGGVSGGVIVGAALSGTAASALCVALGVPTAGLATLTCAVVAVGAGSVAAGVAGGKAGGWAGNILYEAVR